MCGFDTILISGLFLAQAAGLVSALATRIGSTYRIPTQVLFSILLAVVGLGMVVTLNFGPTCWLTSGVTFSIMVLTVTCDFGDSRRLIA